MLIIINGGKRAKTLIGSNPHKIGAPINKSQFKNTLQTSIDFQIAFLEYFEEISFHYPSDKLWNFFKNTEFILSHIFTSQPIPQTDVFYMSSVQFSHSVMSDSLRLHESQHARPPCLSPTPKFHSHSRPSSQ